MAYKAGPHNMTARQGSTFTETMNVKVNGSPMNLTGYTARMMVRTRPSDETVILSLTTENGKITITGAAGQLTLLVSAAEMDGIAARTYRYDLELDNGSQVIPLLEGQFKVEPQVTR